VAIRADITESKKSEDALEQSRNNQLRFKDEFLSHVSHEFRSPLTAIKQFTTILLGGLAGELNSTQREYQQVVLKNILQLQSMIDDLLEVTRLEIGKLA
jgi:signal transduction histidine kinase